ncbi:MAG: efflux RND transporter permease subunit [Akkermansia sp.]|nr:efflux RND transporter permease subunit [Akkermansia sp.]
MSAYFIKHPVIATVIAVVTTLLGLVCLQNLPIAQYPEITPTIVQLQGIFPGADAQSVADSVGTPLEREVSGVQNMNYMTSVSSNNGVYNLVVVFDPKSDPDLDQVFTNMRYGQASSRIPTEVLNSGVTIRQMPGLPLVMYALTSPDNSWDPVHFSNYAQIKMVDELKRVPGVGEVNVYGAGRYAIRVWLDTVAMTHLNISAAEVRQAIQQQNMTNPGGKIGADPVPGGQEKTYTVRTQGRLSSPEQFGDIIVRQEEDQIVYLKDIAQIELGSENYSVTGRVNGRASASVVVFQAPGSNAIETVDRLKEVFEKQAAAMPPGLEGELVLDTTTAVRASIKEIRATLIEAVVLVALVVFVFLQSWRATLIPLIAVPVSLLSTFAVFPILGFTLNTISLLGMVLAIGLVVDDAIVVVEAVQHHIDKGLNPRMAAFAAMQEVSGPVVAIALVLAAVFLPSLLLEGITGTLFKQFAITIAISMLISAFNALTLSPALCTILLRPSAIDRASGHSRLKRIYMRLHDATLGLAFRIFNKGYNGVANTYTMVCGKLSRSLVISIPLLVLFWASIHPLSNKVPGAFLPDEDQGFLLAALIMRPDNSLQVSYDQAVKLENAIWGCDYAKEPEKADPALKHVTSVVGINILNFVQTPGAAVAFVELKDWKDRPGVTLEEVKKRIEARVYMAGLDGLPMVMQPPAIPGVGVCNGVSMVLLDLEGQGVPYLHENVEKFKAAAERLPEVAQCMHMMMPDTPQKFLSLDKEKCLSHKVDIGAANAILSTYNGSLFVNFFNNFGQQWAVYLQARGTDRTDIDKMEGYFITNREGERVPLAAIVNVQDVADTEFVMHHNIYNGAKLTVMPKPEYSTQQLMVALEKLYATEMDTTRIGMDYEDMSFQENKVRHSASMLEIFAMSGVFAFLILVALYEKWTLPLSVFMTVPIAVAGAYAGLWVMGLELNLYAQVGLVMLVGLAAKNAILIVEFANLEIQRGKGLMEATLAAARLRFRPIVMTSLAFILGCLPLMFSTGSGAMARCSIGTVVVMGMAVATVVGVFLIPCSYVFIMRIFRITFKLNDLAADPDEEGARRYLAADAQRTPQDGI